MAIIPSPYFILEIKINKYNRILRYIAFYHSSLDRQTIIFKYFIMNCLVWLLLPAFFNSLASGTTLSKSGKFTISGTYPFFIELRLFLIYSSFSLIVCTTFTVKISGRSVEYAHGGKGSARCPKGYSSMTTAIECEKAANFFDMTFKVVSEFSSLKGCVTSGWDGVYHGMFFNEHPPNRRTHPNQAVVCVEGILFCKI